MSMDRKYLTSPILQRQESPYELDEEMDSQINTIRWIQNVKIHSSNRASETLEMIQELAKNIPDLTGLDETLTCQVHQMVQLIGSQDIEELHQLSTAALNQLQEPSLDTGKVLQVIREI